MQIQEIEQFLAKVATLADLDANDRRVLAGHAELRQFKAGEALFRQGDPARGFFVLVEGRVVIGIPAISGPSLRVQELGAGRILGWSWLLAPYRWSFQAIAETAGEALFFDGQAILAHCEEDPRFGFELIKRFSQLMGERLDAAHRKMMEQWSPAGFA